MLRNGLEPWHIVILAIVIALLFGWKKMPDMARNFGRSARILRSEMDEMKAEKRSEPPAAGVKDETQPADATPAAHDTTA